MNDGKKSWEATEASNGLISTSFEVDRTWHRYCRTGANRKKQRKSSSSGNSHAPAGIFDRFLDTNLGRVRTGRKHSTCLFLQDVHTVSVLIYQMGGDLTVVLIVLNAGLGVEKGKK